MDQSAGGQQPRTLSREQKAALVLLLILGIGGLVFGLQSFRSHARRPFELQLLKYALENPEYVPLSEREERAKKELQGRDTDLDTLNDYDELYVYRTSAYLADTDSDGVDDATEVALGENPNCPTGKTCDLFAVNGEATTEGQVEPEGLVNPGELTPGSILPAYLEPGTGENPQEVFAKMTVAEIRQFLMTNGIPKETLDKMDDATLRKLFEESLKETSSAFEGESP